MNMNIILIILLSGLTILYITEIIKENKRINELKTIKLEELKELFKESWDKEEKDFNLKKTELEVKEKEIEGKIAQLESIFKEKENQYKEINQDLSFYREGKMEEIDSAAAEYEKRKQLIVDASIIQYREARNNLYNQELKAMDSHKQDLVAELELIKEELEIERSKRAAINEEIRRAREVEEQQDFYRIQLNSEDIEDIKLLRSVASRLRHPEVINKVIWSGYYQKPLAELRKRAGTEESGIYKITRIKTGEVYLGQSTNISARWAEHCKAALGVGTLASSQLHRAMAQDSPENFTFEVVEKVEKSKLRERESYYIDFYDSKNYGLNAVRGDQNK